MYCVSGNNPVTTKVLEATLGYVGVVVAVGAGLPKGTRKTSKFVFAGDVQFSVAVLVVIAVELKLIGVMVHTGVLQFTMLLYTTWPTPLCPAGLLKMFCPNELFTDSATCAGCVPAVRQKISKPKLLHI